MHLSSMVIMGLAPLAHSFPHFANSGLGHPIRSPVIKSGNGTGRLTPNHFFWKAPGPGDQRSPCPTMNTLANHGFVPHDGRNITLEKLTKGVKDALNVAEARALNIFETALAVNPLPNATFFDLEMLHAHNVIEHDGSLSRRDAVFDPTNSFDKGTFDNFVSYFGDEQAINTSIIANARARHALDMSEINPSFSIIQEQIPVIVGENAFMLAIFGHPENPVANRSFMEYFFRNERLPVELGWTPSDTPIDTTLGQFVQDIIAQSPPDVPLTFTPQSPV
ncbi:putative sterigmatocystin biosynthesis peroxidase stcC [Colletotrichum gloeosporioides]|uniref:Putative sterigmatocystin biosynthesis peroxidase stcC n=1 Tax=Colletotrichum gloeosporioides TaxID=474922 RepID=A0A8H4FLG7_COLGL|nr:putative sterigmatocystin biosynthesis peroxidase stcC [Colletotrichum gloeosporioides]KAF3806286.1 putative sterigmatocystin biosynthesis peroxidase stcC [Colletotrichum gloeosporioides]